MNNTEGLSASGLGSDYASSNSPYQVKLDGTGDYILYSNDSKPYISKVYFKVKMIGGGNTSTITIKTSDDGLNYTKKKDCSISGSQNNVKEFIVDVNTSAKYLQLYFTKGSNVGFGPLIIYTKSSSYQNYTTQCTTETAISLIPKIGIFRKAIFGVSSGYLRLRVLPCRSFAYHSITNSHIKSPPYPSPHQKAYRHIQSGNEMVTIKNRHLKNRFSSYQYVKDHFYAAMPLL